MEIPRMKTIIYRLEDEIVGDAGSDLHVSEAVVMKYQELVDLYMVKTGILTEMAGTNDLIKKAYDDELERLIEKHRNLDGTKKMIELARNKGLDLSFN